MFDRCAQCSAASPGHLQCCSECCGPIREVKLRHSVWAVVSQEIRPLSSPVRPDSAQGASARLSPSQTSLVRASSRFAPLFQQQNKHFGFRVANFHILRALALISSREEKTKVALYRPPAGGLNSRGGESFFRLGLARIGDGYRKVEKVSLIPTGVPDES